MNKLVLCVYGLRNKCLVVFKMYIKLYLICNIHKIYCIIIIMYSVIFHLLVYLTFGCQISNDVYNYIITYTRILNQLIYNISV